MDLEEVIEAHQNLVVRVRGLMADHKVQHLLLEALLRTLPPEGLDAVIEMFRGLSESHLANGLVHSRDPSGRAIEAFEEAVRRQEERFASRDRAQ